MNDNEIRIKIAEACGMIPPFLTHNEEWCDVGGGGTIDVLRDANFAEVPDYCNDLNAMHGAEETIMFPEAYASRIQIVLHRDWMARGKNVAGFSTTAWFFAFAHATARQRAEAFLRAIDKWKASTPNGEPHENPIREISNR